ncbi:D-aminoacylase [Hydrogenophaga sp. YM1]|uniref:N-acyl-D-amino-acid deacylase family protein n=1 Tax=Hydrogenophaga sp. YM1 TaxID=2806262 RepID=UPI00195648A7|nr:D-aminoacylase [Hydrogenophaga sp. YM1]QRR34323.1 D-aminoacylase [Hydrogenophaga sp. YM1]
MFDVIFKNGTVFDGSGGHGEVRDVGVRDGRIEAIGALGEDASQLVECSGLTVAPGFIDIHTHSDATLLSDPDGYSLLMQGVTTEIIGNCGFSCAPCLKRELVERFMIGRLPGQAFTWSSFGEYLDVLQAQRPGLNVGAYVGHNTVRLNVVGNEPRGATDDELQYMGNIMRRSLEEGAIGVSSGLEYNPGFNSDLRELVEMAKVAKEFDAVYASHIRNRDWNYEMGLGEALATARLSQARLQLSHLAPKTGAPAHAAEHMLEMIEWTRQSGADVGFDVIPHEWGPTFLYTILPKWAYEGGVPAMLQRLADPDQRAALKNNTFPQWKLVAQKRWSELVLTRSAGNRELIGLDFAEIGRRRGVDPHDAILDILLEEGEAVADCTWAGRISEDQDIRLLMSQPGCAVISDAITLNTSGPLKDVQFAPTAFGWTARFLGHYARDLDMMDLGEGIRRLTSLPAQRMGLKARGSLQKGYHADVVVFDAHRISDRSSVQNMAKSPQGLLHVMVNGQFAVKDGSRTAVRAGQVLRR